MSLAYDSVVLDRPAWVTHRSRGERRWARRELARHDRRSARLAELVTIRDALAHAVEIVDRGWLQNAFFSYRHADGQVHVSYVASGRASQSTVLSRCLVAAIRDAARSPARSDDQVAGRAVEATWHALYDNGRPPIQWCPAPDVRAAHVRDLTRWNDRPGRTSSEVATLLEAAIRVADRERQRVAVS
ncbi:MAG: hypothetical protein ABI873_09885 [Marmoricola sp.]